MQGVVRNRTQVLVLLQELGCRLAKGTVRSNTEHLGLPGPLEAPRQVFLRFRAHRYKCQCFPTQSIKHS